MEIVELFKEGDRMAVATTATEEEQFISGIAQLFAELIESEKFEGDWEFQLLRWIPQIVDIVCKLRGYKSTVYEERRLIAGYVDPKAFLIASIDSRSKVTLTELFGPHKE